MRVALNPLTPARTFRRLCNHRSIKDTTSFSFSQPTSFKPSHLRPPSSPPLCVSRRVTFCAVRARLPPPRCGGSELIRRITRQRQPRRGSCGAAAISHRLQRVGGREKKRQWFRVTHSPPPAERRGGARLNNSSRGAAHRRSHTHTRTLNAVGKLLLPPPPPPPRSPSHSHLHSEERVSPRAF